MALRTDLQRGRILALVWLDPQFKEEFEKNPTKAFKILRTTRADELRQTYGESILQDLGIDDPNFSLSNFEAMSWLNVDFWSISGNELDACIQGNRDDIVPGESSWFWNAQSEAALGATPDTLTRKEWGRIYARIWMDYRLSNMDQQLREKYGPQRWYVERFEKHPAVIVEEIAKDINMNGWGTEIKFALGVTRLFVVQAPPASLAALIEADKTVVKTGLPGNQPLSWEVNKCG